jgi:hypothetical protein
MSLLRERQLSAILVQEMPEWVAANLSQALDLGDLTASAFFTEQDLLQLSSLRCPTDRVPFPMNSESVLTPVFRPERPFPVPGRNGAHHLVQPLAFARVASVHSKLERAVVTQAGTRCSRQGEVPLVGERKRRRRRKGGTFPVVLHRLLLEVESLGSQAIISFTPSGCAFRVH